VISLVRSISLGSLIDKLPRKAICGIIPSICLDVTVCTGPYNCPTEIGGMGMIWRPQDRCNKTTSCCHTNNNNQHWSTNSKNYWSISITCFSFGKKHTSPFTMNQTWPTKASEASGNSLSGMEGEVVQWNPGPCCRAADFDMIDLNLPNGQEGERSKPVAPPDHLWKTE
jgi:hypothetical protein